MAHCYLCRKPLTETAAACVARGWVCSACVHAMPLCTEPHRDHIYCIPCEARKILRAVEG